MGLKKQLKKGIRNERKQLEYYRERNYSHMERSGVPDFARRYVIKEKEDERKPAGNIAE